METKDKKKLAAGVGAGALAVALIGGGTFALWSDFEDVQGNSLAAGTLELDLTGANGDVVPLMMTNMAPGENKAQEFFIANRGDDTQALRGALVTVQLQDLVDEEDGCPTQSEDEVDDTCDAGPDGEFSQEANIQFAYGPQNTAGGCDYGSRQNFVLADAENESIALGNIDPDEGLCLRIEAGLPASLGTGGDAADGIDFGPNTDSTNASQGDGSTFNLRFDLTQVIPN